MKGLNPGQPILTVTNLKRKFGERSILANANFSLQPGDRVGVLGVNGAGKSSLMKIVAGRDREFEGVCAVAKGATVGYVAQEPELDFDKTVRENVEQAVADTRRYIQRYEEILKAWEDPEVYENPRSGPTRSSKSRARSRRSSSTATRWTRAPTRKIEQAMEALRLPPGDKPTSVLSGGERRRVSLCKILLAHPDLLILDEPTNHLDAETMLWLEHFLGSYYGSYMLVTHDRYFLDHVANRMLEVDQGEVPAPTRATTPTSSRRRASSRRSRTGPTPTCSRRSTAS